MSAHAVAGFLVLYSGGVYRYFLGPFDVAKLDGWPSDDVQIGLVFFDAEWTPGKPYRQIMMGNDRYFYIPSTGVIGHSNESRGQIRQRYGSDALIWDGKWTTMDEMHQLIAVANDCDELGKLTDAWLTARINEARGA